MDNKEEKIEDVNSSKIEEQEILKKLTIWNKDLIKKGPNNTLIINSSGGEFFPNKVIPIVAPYFLIFGFGSLLMCVCSHFNFLVSNEQTLWLFLIFILNMILFLVVSILTSIKAEFIFSSNGIDIHSKKGSLFIPKEDINEIYIEEVEEMRQAAPNKKEVGSIIHYITFTFKKEIYITYAKTYKKKITFLPDIKFIEYVYNSYAYDTGIVINPKIQASYIVQEIKKALEFKL